MKDILIGCHTSPCGGHFGGKKTAQKVLKFGFYWPTMIWDAYKFMKRYDRCQKTRNVSKSGKMSQKGILKVEVLDLWGINFMGQFPNTFENQYIRLVVDYVSKWVEAMVFR